MMRRSGFSVSCETMWHVRGVRNIGEGDMSVCFWAQYFNANTTLVVSKDTDMLMLLSLVCPGRPRELYLRLDSQNAVDLVDIFIFKQWVKHRFHSYLDGFLYITLQGNDYVQKVANGCGAEKMLDAIAQNLRRSDPSCISMADGVFTLDERLLESRMRSACTRGKLRPAAGVLMRQGWWYLYYSILAVNGIPSGGDACHRRVDGCGDLVFGWVCDPSGDIVVAERVAACPRFSIV